ncbi:hypothetical protein C1645_882157 [Glomus cerebriforme]|uniref:F-box domain-containing protein n=1 Tax=Glomus cerebriforme TaxID=658196 RepID=A0A397S202_9GLOM|nr:hypothetical protein C1645_882157 [Glomus cerebriforme]
MPILIKDILYLIFEELENDKKTLRSCLSINKTWCEMIVPVLWKNPWKYLKSGKGKLLLKVIISHLSDKSRNDLIQRFNFLKNLYQKPLFDYISYCKILNFNEIKKIIHTIDEKSDIPIIENAIINLLINKNTKFTHLYIPHLFNHQLHLIPGADHCFSELQFLHCNTNIEDNVLIGLTKACKSIKELELSIEKECNNYKIVKLVEIPKKLSNIHLLIKHYSKIDEPFCNVLENTLIQHVNSIQYFTITGQPTTEILSSFVNLKSLELDDGCRRTKWNCIENLSLPFLQILNVKGIPIEVLTKLIENTNGSLIELKINDVCHSEINNNKIIQAIYKNCSKLKYLKLLFKYKNILELEKVLINCQDLNGLYINIDLFDDNLHLEDIDWKHLFKILTNSSPVDLFKFKFFHFNETPDLKSLKSFFDNWKGRNPMLLQFNKIQNKLGYIDLFENYKKKGIIKKYDTLIVDTFDDFEWIRKKI